MSKLKIAALQINAEPGPAAARLDKIEKLIKQAARQGARDLHHLSRYSWITHSDPHKQRS
jgi:predicted amidohydrolase